MSCVGGVLWYPSPYSLWETSLWCVRSWRCKVSMFTSCVSCGIASHPVVEQANAGVVSRGWVQISSAHPYNRLFLSSKFLTTKWTQTARSHSSHEWGRMVVDRARLCVAGTLRTTHSATWLLLQEVPGSQSCCVGEPGVGVEIQLALADSVALFTEL